MAAENSNPTNGGNDAKGVLVISVWKDDELVAGDHAAVRMRVLTDPRLPGAGEFTYAATVEDVLDIVGRWLQYVVTDRRDE